MKIYLQDFGYYGIIAVVAKDENQARLLMQESVHPSYSKDKPVEELEIKEGTVIISLGDS